MGKHRKDIFAPPFKFFDFSNIPKQFNPSDKILIFIKKRRYRGNYGNYFTAFLLYVCLYCCRLPFFLESVLKQRAGFPVACAMENLKMRFSNHFTFQVTGFHLSLRVKISNHPFFVNKSKTYCKTVSYDFINLTFFYFHNLTRKLMACYPVFYFCKYII